MAMNPLLTNLSGVGRSTGLPSRQPSVARPTGDSFGTILRRTLDSQTGNPINLTAHAEKRLAERNISLEGPVGRILNEALDELQAKGARDSLVVTGNGAFVVNVPSRTLITAMDPNEMQDRIVTQIDSVSLKSFR